MNIATKKKPAVERKNAWEISCKEAKKLIKESQGDWEKLDSIEGFKLVGHMETCSKCDEKMKNAVKKKENATEKEAAFYFDCTNINVNVVFFAFRDRIKLSVYC